ncbi:MAG: AAA family ATPase [Streptosporangiaceae bacterium]|nr:AAA family ATPase [Streptosporangiaceae bacterium]MBV9855266.1 AAA family ATPase [Streptosporangiaceae bacterium]
MEGGGAPTGLLLERTAELGAIAAAIRSACSGSGTALLVEGPAGIGKTRLLGHACEQAARAGMTVLTARAAEFEDGYAWGVVRQLFEAQVRAGDTAGPADDAVRLAAPVLARGAASAEEDSFAVLHGLYWLAVGIARRAPLVIAVDDVHWADQPSLRFVVHLARRVAGLRVLLVLTVREPRSGSAHDKALTASLAAETNVTVLRPAALSAAGCASLLGTTLAADPSLSFQEACRELTGGNPLLVQGLVASLAAEGVRGTDAEVPHLRRLTPGTVSRSVLLQLGRMPPAALAAARAIAVLGTAATTERAAKLARLDADTCAEAVSMLMAERLIEGERELGFVHPLVRSAVYEDLAPPLRQGWHKRAARMLDDEDAPSEVMAVHLLAAAAAGDPWMVDRLRRAAADARSRGAPDIATQCLERALAEPPPPDARRDVLFELGKSETFYAPAAAAGHLADALARSAEWPRRAEIALALSQALALCGRFAEAVKVLRAQTGEHGDEHSAIAMSLQAALLNVARWDLSTRPVTGPILHRLQARAAAGEELDPQLHANLAIELTAAGEERELAVRHAREAVRATPRLMSLTSSALPEAVSVLVFADLTAEAWEAAQAWLRLAQQRGWELASAVAASAAAVIAQYGGDTGEVLAYGHQATAGGDEWISVIATAFMIPALADRGAIEEARAMLAARNLTGQLEATWPYNVARFARGCLLAATGEHDAAVADMLTAGELAERWGIHNPALMPWRSQAALSLGALGDRKEAGRLCAEEISLARHWGAARAIGVALRAAGLVADGDRGIESLTEAVRVLRDSSGRLELARALLDLGAAQRRAGARTTAREYLRESLDLAYALGGLAIADRARQELVAAGSRPRRAAMRGRDALTPSELRVAEMAANGRTNRQIAQALFITQRTVETHLTSTYGKLGISSRPGLAAALSARRP